MIPVSSSLQPNPEQLARLLRESGKPTLELSSVAAKALPSFEVGEEVTAKIVDTYGSNRFTVLVKDKLMTLNLDRRHAFVGDSGSTIKLVVATVEPKLSFAMDAKAPMHMPDSSSKVLLSPATRYLSTLLFVANAADDAAQPKNLPLIFQNKPGIGIASVSSLVAELADSVKSAAVFGGAKLSTVSESATAMVKTKMALDPELSKGTTQAQSSQNVPRVLDAAGKAQSASAARFPPGLSSLLGGEKANAGGQALALSPLFENMDALPTTGMAQLLKQAVTRSGVFYESHLADWAQSGRSLHALRQEPQANLKLPEKLAELGKPDGQNNASVQEAMKTGSATGLRDRELAGLRNDSNTTQLGQLVHKQLDVLDQNQFSWQGIAWPGQAMDWRIEREQVDQREAHGGGEEESRWSTSLSMELPNLGGLAAKIALTPAGVIVRFQTDSADTAQAIEDNQLRLRENLQRAGLSLLNFAVSQGEQPNAG